MSCPAFPQMDLSELSAELREQLGDRRYPMGGMFELTDRCNLNCVHCYINQSPGDRDAIARELTTNQVKTILDQVADAGTLFLTFTGGEALLRKDFPEIYEHAIRRGLLVGIFSNGTLITPETADLLAELRPHWIEITLYGATRETYERVTRKSGAYDRCMDGLKLLKSHHLPVYLKSSILTLNRHELSQMRAFAENLNVPFRYDGLIWPRLDGKMDALNYQLSPQELVALEEEDPERLEGWCEMADMWRGKLVRASHVYSCGAGLQSYNIDSRGRLSVCTMSRQPAYSLLGMGFKQAWEKLGELRMLKREIDTPCQTCTLGGLCSQCPGWSQAVHGDNETPVEFLCELAHLRKMQVENLCVSNINHVIINS
jgi:radical SAM protein with 4Fe4S-binding SPASM domain